MYNFRIFDFVLSSELYFPELLTSLSKNKDFDIKIKYASISITGLERPEKKGAFFQKNTHSIWLYIDKIARFLISNGNEIIIEPIGSVDEETLRVFTLTCCFKYLLLQRNLLTLQGSVIQIGENAVSFVAPSGFGKSVLCALFLNKHYKILSDEICSLDNNSNVLSSYPEITLWKRMAEQLNIDISSLKTVRPGLEKFIIPLGNSFQNKSRPLKLIYILDYHKKNQLNMRVLSDDEKTKILKQHFLMPNLFNRYHEKIIQNIEIVKLLCPRWKYGGHELGSLLSSEFNAIEQDLIRRLSKYGT